ncbi:hypothetical protein IE53DRAFT_43866 [Violaceomyces palustris]|uniref:Uncharacterized protein n=1 Tax=Violaceomyces palustris TaxID=1673888 RepID=A0ACD0P0P3_9BASI|nr:hypothetical protein IE53DRAFT_43866 [Violaceomyces palustris]
MGGGREKGKLAQPQLEGVASQGLDLSIGERQLKTSGREIPDCLPPLLPPVMKGLCPLPLTRWGVVTSFLFPKPRIGYESRVSTPENKHVWIVNASRRQKRKEEGMNEVHSFDYNPGSQLPSSISCVLGGQPTERIVGSQSKVGPIFFSRSPWLPASLSLDSNGVELAAGVTRTACDYFWYRL